MEFPSKSGGASAPGGAVAAVGASDEATHFARELHDQVAQPLIGLILELHEVRTRQEMSESLRAEMSRVEDSVRRILRQTREMLVDLRGPANLRLDFAQALRSELVRNPAGPVETAVHVTSRWPKPINGWAAFNLLRIAQEAVTNACRHGRAHKIDIFLDTNHDAEAVMVVIDDGSGIDDVPHGLGIVGMTERAVILGGAFKAESRPMGGTRVEVRIPVDHLT